MTANAIDVDFYKLQIMVTRKCPYLRSLPLVVLCHSWMKIPDAMAGYLQISSSPVLYVPLVCTSLFGEGGEKRVWRWRPPPPPPSLADIPAGGGFTAIAASGPDPRRPPPPGITGTITVMFLHGTSPCPCLAGVQNCPAQSTDVVDCTAFRSWESRVHLAGQAM